MKTGRFDIHQHITDKIVSAIERGAGDFRLPWHRSAGGIMRPVNITSRKAYRGVNVVALWAYAEEFGYSSGVWGTYKQWAEAGGQVRQGEKAAFVVFYKELAADPETGEAEPATRLFACATPVFAAEQVDGFMPSTFGAPPITVTTPIEQAEAFVAATGASIHHGGGRDFYRPSTDSIHLPPREAFIGTKTSTPAESYFSTLCHELTHNAEPSVMPRRSRFTRKTRANRRWHSALCPLCRYRHKTHWTAHKSRLDRDLKNRFGSRDYAAEELVAELASVFICAEFGINKEVRHASYIAHWIELLKHDDRAFFTAASKAQKAADYLRGIALAEPVSELAPIEGA